MKNGKYTLVKAPKEYPGILYRGRYCYEHHLVWWKEIGELLSSEDCLHHINGIHTDNRIENLECLKLSEHSRQHHKPKSYKMLLCSSCGKTFQRSLQRINKGVKKYYCSWNCRYEKR